jgi:hypothetical protein
MPWNTLFVKPGGRASKHGESWKKTHQPASSQAARALGAHP